MKGCCQTTTRRGIRLAAWILPAGALVLMPKCPACIAAYVLLFTGVGISLPVADGLRWVAIAGCVLVLAILAVGRWQRKGMKKERA